MEAPFPQEEALEAIFALNQTLTPPEEALGRIREERDQEENLWAL